MPYIVYRAPPTFLSEQRLDPRIKAGQFTYFDELVTFAIWRDDDEVVLGRYCSIARDCTIFGGGNHYANRATTYPFQAFGAGGDDAFDLHTWEAPNAGTVVGHDVWLGHGARIMAGARIGHGCIVGAGAVVAGTVAPYSLVAGNPAVVVRKRFSDRATNRLLELAWWDWPLARVLANLDLLMLSPEAWPDTLELRSEEPFKGTTLPIARPVRARIMRRFAAARRRLSSD